MCFTRNISLVFGFSGVIIYFVLKHIMNWKVAFIALYFGIMEFLQFFSFYYLDDCNNNINILLAKLQYLHISFQPLIIYYSLWHLAKFIKDKNLLFQKQSYFPLILIGCILLASRNLIVTNKEDIEQSCWICGKKDCVRHGEKHFKLEVALRKSGIFTPSFFFYGFLFSIPAILLSWKIYLPYIIFIFATGICIPKYFLKVPEKELGTVWCLLSVSQILGIFIIYYLFVK